MKLPEHFSVFFDMSNPLAQRYIDFIYACHDKANYKENHHIIPRAWYKRQCIPVDNSTENIIVLSGKDHFKAHYLMFKYLESTSDVDMTFRMLFPLVSMIQPFQHKDCINLSDAELEQCGIMYHDAREKFCLLQCQMIWATDGIINKRFHQDEPLPDGWIPNKRISHTDLKYRWITDGKHTKRILNTARIPTGFRPGVCAITFDPNTDIWITNGIDTRKWRIDEPLPYGWRFGSHCCLGKLKITNGVENKMIGKDEPLPTGWRYGVTVKSDTDFAHTTGKVHICKDGVRKMVAREDLSKWLAEGWTNHRGCSDPASAGQRISEAKKDVLVFTNGKETKRVLKSEAKTMYEAGWWFTNIKRRYPGVLLRDYGIDYDDLKRRFGYEYDGKWIRLVV